MNDRLRETLLRAGATFQVMTHPEVYTAQERAAASHVTGHRLAKVVVVRDVDWFGLAVVPAAAVLDLDGLRALTGRPQLTLAREKDFAPLFPDCEPGAMPPFGQLYGMSAFLDTSLADEPELVFEGGTHREEIRMPMHEYLRVERPAIAAVGSPPQHGRVIEGTPRAPRLQRRGVMAYVGGLIGSFALGVALTHLLDPVHGRRRRALIRDKAVSAAHAAQDAAGTTSRDLGNRGRGVLAGLRSRLAPEAVSDEVLVERVRARLGGAVGHPHAISVTAEDGCVTLAGQILASEMDAAVRRAAGTRGVRLVDNQLVARVSAQRVPDLQGEPGARRDSGRFELLQEQWSPTARLLTGAAGAALAAWGLRRAGLVGAVAGGAGATLSARAMTNLELKRLFGVGAGRHAVIVQKTVHVAASPEEVYNVWSRYEAFPSFMANVREVRREQPGRAHWRIAGPLGLPIEFDTTETRRVRNELISWKTLEGSPVAHAGTVRFDPDARGTRIHLQMVYNPPGGAVGHGLATLLGTDPRRLMHGDLVRLKSLLEDGKTRAHGQSVEREALG